MGRERRQEDAHQILRLCIYHSAVDLSVTTEHWWYLTEQRGAKDNTQVRDSHGISFRVGSYPTRMLNLWTNGTIVLEYNLPVQMSHQVLERRIVSIRKLVHALVHTYLTQSLVFSFYIN
jgi:hypothetical protein